MNSTLDLDPESDRWMLAESSSDDGTLFIRVNQTARKYVGHPDLNIRLGFAVPLKKTTGVGLPDADENELLASVEDLIRSAVANSATGIHVLTLTNAVMKELVFYIRPGADIAAMHKRLMRDVTTHEVQCMAVRDPDWETYKGFSPD